MPALLTVLTDWFLFASDCLRISPPLIISEEQIKKHVGDNKGL
jgi:hypothetical protein